MMGLKRYSLVFAVLLILALVLVVPVSAGTSPQTISPSGSSVTDVNNINTAIVNAGAGGTVILNPGTYDLGDVNVANDITITADTADGHGPWDTIIDGVGEDYSTFMDTGGYSLAIDNLTLQNEGISGSGGAIDAPNGGSIIVTSSSFNGCTVNTGGGAIFATGSVTVTSSSFTDCSAGTRNSDKGTGGAIQSGGSVTATSSTFTGCTAGLRAGAIYTTGSVTVTSSTFSGCGVSEGSGNDGGAIYAYGGSVTATSSTFTGCSAMTGGAIYANSGSVTATSSMFTGCSAMGGSGGAIYATGRVTATSSTFTGCSAMGGSGGAIYADDGGTIQFCRIYQDSLGTAVYKNAGSLDASDNWWGTNSSPTSSDTGGSSITTSPYLNLGISASPSTITTGGTSTISANLNYDENGNPTSGGSITNGTPVVFTSGDGTLSVTTAYTDLGVVSTTFTPSSPGTSYITATVDGQSVSVPVTVTTATTTINTTSIAIDPRTPSDVYAGLDGVGIYYSTTSGGSWTAAMTQPGNTNITALVIDPVDSTRIFAATNGGGVYQSTNSAANWNACPAEPTNKNVISLAANATGALYAGTESGVYISDNNCTSWTAINTGLP